MSVSRDHGSAWWRFAWLLLVGVAALVTKRAPASARRADLQSAVREEVVLSSHSADDELPGDRGPGEDDPQGDDPANGLRGYTIGLGLVH